MRDTFHDLETWSPRNLKHGTHQYAEQAEVMLWGYALEHEPAKVWDVVNGRVHWEDDLSGLWESCATPGMPTDLERLLREDENLVWFQNGGHFDFVVLKHAMPKAAGMISTHRRRDTMVQASAASFFVCC